MAGGSASYDALARPLNPTYPKERGIQMAVVYPRNRFLRTNRVALLILLGLCGMVGIAFTGASGTESPWVPIIEGAEFGEPVSVDVLETSLDSIVIRVQCPGLSVAKLIRDGAELTEVDVFGESRMNVDGWPALPAIMRVIAAPEFSSIEIHAESEDSIVVQLQAPIAEHISSSLRGARPGNRINIPLPNSPKVPESLAEISQVQRVRDLNTVWLSVYPIQYEIATQRLECHPDIRVTIRFRGASRSVASRGVGPYERVFRRRVIGYSHQEAPEVLASSPGAYRRCEGPDAISCCSAYQTDYLIIAADEFFRNSWIDSLAAKRASYNGFNVTIVNTDSLGIESPSQDRAVRDFIDSLYNTESAGHMSDGHLGYVLLAGSFVNLEGDTLVPAHFLETDFEDRGFSPTYPSDNWFVCLGDYDSTAKEDELIPDVLIGRLCARDTTELRVLAQKTLSWEPLPADSAGWSSTILMTTAHPLEYRERLNLHERDVVDRLIRETSALAERASYKVRILRGEDYDGDLTAAGADSLNRGAKFMTYSLHSDGCGCEMGDPPVFTSNSVETLDNRDSLCVVFTTTCASARFAPSQCPCCPDHCTDDAQSETIGVKFMTHEGGGAVAYIGTSDPGWLYWDAPRTDKPPSVWFFQSVLEYGTPFVGEALLDTKMGPWGGTNYCGSMTLLGDPALNVNLREGFHAYCDLGVRSDEMFFEPPDLSARPSVCSTTVWVNNRTHVGVPNIQVGVRFDTKPVGSEEWSNLGIQYVDSIPPWGRDSAVFVWSCDSLALNGSYLFRAWVDFEDSIPQEAYLGNNEALKELRVGIDYDPDKRFFGGGYDNQDFTAPAAAFFPQSTRSTHDALVFSQKDGTVFAVNPNPQGSAELWNYQDTLLTDPLPVACGDLEVQGTVLQVVCNESRVHVIDGFDSINRLKWSVELSDSITARL